MNSAMTGTWQVRLPYADLRNKPSVDGGLETQVLHGEAMRVLGREAGWLHVETILDDYKGYVWELDLSPTMQSSTHKIMVPRAVVYQEPSFKSAAEFELNMNARIYVRERLETQEGLMMRCALGWLYADQVIGVHQYASDFVAVAMQFLETPYGWGWRSSKVDCSALLQHALIATGISCPRNSGQQAASLGKQIPFPKEGEYYLRGDLVFWTEAKGKHIVIMVDGVNCIHATIAPGRRGVVLQPLSQVIEEQERDGNGRPTICRRIPTYSFG